MGKSDEGALAHNDDPERAESESKGRRKPAAGVAAPPQLQPDNSLQVALGMQVMMQRSSLDSLSEPIQQEMIRLAETLDERAYQYSCKLLDERAATRKWATLAICGFGLVLVIAGAFFANKLINADKFEQALTVIMTGIGVVGALLGGAGLQSVFKSLSDR